MDWGEQILPNKVTAHDIDKRFRMGAKSVYEDRIWFDFENARTEEDFEKVALKTVYGFLTNSTKGIWEEQGVVKAPHFLIGLTEINGEEPINGDLQDLFLEYVEEKK